MAIPRRVAGTLFQTSDSFAELIRFLFTHEMAPFTAAPIHSRRGAHGVCLVIRGVENIVVCRAGRGGVKLLRWLGQKNPDILICVVVAVCSGCCGIRLFRSFDGYDCTCIESCCAMHDVYVALLSIPLQLFFSSSPYTMNTFAFPHVAGQHIKHPVCSVLTSFACARFSQSSIQHTTQVSVSIALSVSPSAHRHFLYSSCTTSLHLRHFTRSFPPSPSCTFLANISVPVTN